jgi:hypothetical protein
MLSSAPSTAASLYPGLSGSHPAATPPVASTAAIPAASHSRVGAAAGRSVRNQRIRLQPNTRCTATSVPTRNSRSPAMLWPSSSNTGP